MLIHISWPVTLLPFALCQPGFKLTSLSWFSADHPKRLCAADLTEVLSNGGWERVREVNCRNTNSFKLNIGHAHSNKPLDLCTPGHFSLVTFLCGFQSPTMLLVFRFLSHLLDHVFPASLSRSKKITDVLWQVESPTRAPSAWSPTEDLADVLNFSLASLPHLLP